MGKKAVKTAVTQKKKQTRLRGSKVSHAVKEGIQRGAAVADFAWKVTNPIDRVKFAVKALKGEGLVFPGTKYIGPGNRMDLGKPVNQADANAYQHDIDYDNYIKKGHKAKDVYLGYSDADERLLKNTKATSAGGIAVNIGMTAKKLLNKTGLTKRIRDTDKP